MPASVMPADLPLPIDVAHGTFQPATAIDVDQSPLDGIDAWDPWTHADLAVMADKSQPATGPYGEPSQPMAQSLTAEWGGMPSPVVDYQNVAGSVAIVKRQIHDYAPTTGVYLGPQQTAWEAAYQEPELDYWSVILGG